MKKEYFVICTILGIPTHGITISEDEFDENGNTICVPTEFSDEIAIKNIINKLQKEM